jgi:hypothetical protein
MPESSEASVPLFLGILVILFAVFGSALLVRAAWLLFRGEYRHGLIHFGLAALAFVVAVAFFFAKSLFIAGA